MPGGASQAYARRMRLEIILFAAISVIVFVTALILPSGDWLAQTLIHDQAGHMDEIIVGVIAVSFVVIIFLLRSWQEVQLGMRAVAQLQKRSVIDGHMSQMTSLLHACFTMEEANAIIARYARQFFPNYSGTLYIFRSSRNILEEATSWGEHADNEQMFSPHQCWALRQGQVYMVADPQHDIACPHVAHDRPYTCLPMMAHGEVLALLYISPNPDAINQADNEVDHLTLLRIFTDRMALALSNLKLRDTLQQQSIRDPLTGMFNRRYLEEALIIETERSKRSKSQFSIIMFDIDHFKRFNDTYGHDAGDVVLQAIGGFIQRNVRGGDIACRYGGEEFTLILPGLAVEGAQQRAKQLSEGIRMLNVDYKK